MTSHTATVSLPGGGHMTAYIARPDVAPNGTGVVLCQEIFGVTASMRSIADDHAARGVAAIVPDLFWRQEPGVELDPSSQADTERAMALMKGMDQEQAAEDALAAADHLRRLDGGPARIGAVGYCIGGKIAYLMAMRSGIEAAASYYGIAIYAALDRATDVRLPMILHIPCDDALCPPDKQTEIKDAFASMPNVEIRQYPGAGHAFARRGGDHYDRVAAEQADAATAAFFHAHLEQAA